MPCIGLGRAALSPMHTLLGSFAHTADWGEGAMSKVQSLYFWSCLMTDLGLLFKQAVMVTCQ